MLIAAVAPLLIACHLSASPVCEVAQPSNIRTGMLQQEFIDLLQRSATFRRQCARIAATSVLRVTLHVGTTMDSRARAETIISRYEAGAIRAEVTLRFAEDYLELLAHEFEHIIEQIDGVSLRDEAAQGRAWRDAERRVRDPARVRRRGARAGRVRMRMPSAPRRGLVRYRASYR